MLFLRAVRPSNFRVVARIRHDIIANVHARRRATDALIFPSFRQSSTSSQSASSSRIPLRQPQAKFQNAQGKARRKPKQVIIYHAGTGKIAFIGMMRVTSILVFIVSCGVVAPAFYASEFPWYIAPAIIIGGAIPMLYISFTAAPFVNQVYLSLPAFAQQSTENMRSYMRKLPRTATITIETMKFNFYPRRSAVSVSDLVPRTSKIRPVSFMNINPQQRPWWQGKENVFYYTPEKSRPARPTSKFFPEAWELVFSLIKKNRAP